MLDTKKPAKKQVLIFGLRCTIRKWWGWRDSNSHTLRRWNLNPVRLPISPRPHQGANFALDFKLAEDQGFEP